MIKCRKAKVTPIYLCNKICTKIVGPAFGQKLPQLLWTQRVAGKRGFPSGKYSCTARVRCDCQERIRIEISSRPAFEFTVHVCCVSRGCTRLVRPAGTDTTLRDSKRTFLVLCGLYPKAEELSCQLQTKRLQWRESTSCFPLYSAVFATRRWIGCCGCSGCLSL